MPRLVPIRKGMYARLPGTGSRIKKEKGSILITGGTMAFLTRRQFLKIAACGAGSAAALHMLSRSGIAAGGTAV